MKKNFLLLKVVIFIGMQFFSGGLVIADNITSPADLDRIVAVVNKDVITKKELNERLINNSIPRQNVLNNLIDELLQLQVAKSNDITVSDKEVDIAINNIAKNNHLTIEQLKQNLKEHTGLDFRQYRRQISKQILLSRVRAPILKDMIISDAEILKEMHSYRPNNSLIKYHVLDILVDIADLSSKSQVAKSKDIATTIATQLKNGIDSDQVIAENKKANPKIIISSNDLDWRRLDELPSLFETQISTMKKDQVSEPILASNGFHILKLLDIASEQVKITKEQAKEITYNKKAQELLKPWIDDLRSSSYIKIMD